MVKLLSTGQNDMSYFNSQSIDTMNDYAKNTFTAVLTFFKLEMYPNDTDASTSEMPINSI